LSDDFVVIEFSMQGQQIRTIDEIDSKIKNAYDKKMFRESLKFADSFHAMRAMQIFAFPTKDETILGTTIMHPEGSYFIEGVIIQMVLEAVVLSQATKKIDDVMSEMLVPDGDWRKSSGLRMFDGPEVVIQEIGQAKILYSTMMPFSNLEKREIVVTVVGSSGVDGGGCSYPVMINALNMEGHSGKIHLYDKFETNSEEKIGNFTVFRYNTYYAYGYEGTKCDVLIDDSYSPMGVGLDKTKLTYSRLSQKSFNVGSPQPHYKGNERRIFEGCSEFQSKCILPGMDECSQCIMWSKMLSSFKYTTAEYIWHSVIRAGVRPCTPYDGQSLAHDVGEFDKEVNRVRRLDIGRNTTLNIGTLAISAAINARAGNVQLFDNIVRLKQGEHQKLFPYRSTIRSGKIQESPVVQYNLIELLIPGKAVGVVGLDPDKYLPVEVELSPPLSSYTVISARIQFLDEMSPPMIILPGTSKIDNYEIDKTIVECGVKFTRYIKNVRRRATSYKKRKYSWEQVITKKIDDEYLVPAILNLRYQLGQNVAQIKFGNYFAKTREELVEALFGLIELREQRFKKERCGDEKCLCKLLGPKKPWDESCQRRLQYMKDSLCGDIPCYCKKLGEKKNKICSDRESESHSHFRLFGECESTVGFDMDEQIKLLSTREQTLSRVPARPLQLLVDDRDRGPTSVSDEIEEIIYFPDYSET